MNSTELDKSISIPSKVILEGMFVYIPHAFLYGIQLPEEYKASRLREIARLLELEGIQHLKRHPVTATIIGSKVVILDGHHRARAAPQADIKKIPIFLIELNTLAAALAIEPSVLANQLLSWVFQAIGAFQNQYNLSRKIYSEPLELPIGVLQFLELKK